MKIISKFRDYYDGVQGLGMDSRIPYVRLTEELPLESLPEKFRVDPHKGGDLRDIYGKNRLTPGINPKYPYLADLDVSFRRVFLCGKSYRFAEVFIPSVLKYRRDGSLEANLPEAREYFYTFEAFCEFVQEFAKEGQNLVQDIYGDKLFGRRPRYAQIEAFLSAQGTDECMEEMVERRLVLLRRRKFHEYRHPRYEYFDHFETNFPLKEIQFFKHLGPTQVYQELDMYVCGVLGQQAKEVVQISDKDRISQHGFDKYSFRKMPEEGKRKKK